MYLSYYNLRQNPFQISTDSRFLWLGPKHEEALATLRYGVHDNKGFLLLTGDVGTGKTTLVNALLKLLGDDTLVAVIRDPNLDTLDFYNYIAHAFKMDREFTSKVSFLIHFEKFLHQAHEAGNKVLLVIDEAQRITQGLLEEVRLLSNIEREESKLLNIFFVGQIEFNEILLRPENRPIRQRITVNYNIPPLTENETGEYIRHRLEVAGTERSIVSSPPGQEGQAGPSPTDERGSGVAGGCIFADAAIKEIFAFSGGYPRLINIICDRCLLTGFVEEAKSITADIVEECREELTITPPPQRSQALIPPLVTQVGSGQPVPTTAARVANPPVASVPEKSRMALGRTLLLVVMFLLLLAAVLLPLRPEGPSLLPGQSALATFGGVWQGLLGKPAARQEMVASKAQETSTPPVADETSPPVAVEEKPAAPAAASATHPAAPPSTDNLSQSAAGLAPGGSPSAPGEQQAVAQSTGSIHDLNSAGMKIITPVIGDKLVIPFSSDSTIASPQSLTELNTLVDTLTLRPEWRVVVRGYTDALGSENYNNKLSEFRAATVRSYLAGRGLDESRITILGMGSQNPVVPHISPAGKTANRRVEIEIVK